MSKQKSLKTDPVQLVNEMLQGNVLSLSRLISQVERESETVPQIMRLIYSHLGKAYRIGITGPPGVGKSTLVEKLTKAIRKQGHSVGIICVDPTSPFTGGAILGDRIRMEKHFLDEEVYIRSMATRGSMGGLPNTVSGVIKLMDAFGKDIILIETVGVGQTELDILHNSDLVIVVLVPDLGDAIQSMKAGLMEIADIFIVNKADRPGADNMVTDLITSLHFTENKNSWEKPVLPTEAINDVGIDRLYEQIEKNRQMLLQTGQFDERRRQQRRKEFLETIEKKVTSKLLQMVEKDAVIADYLSRIDSGIAEPYSAADELLHKHFIEVWAKQL